ncbi:MAG: hypothetical protein AAF191_04960 [Verrucomicrobiota bacterium]
MAAGPNLREQLKKILPEILPKNPQDSIKGTELIQLVKYRLSQNYSDATLRYHFSIMSCDPSSPIAKVEQGQGYYLRSTTLHSLESARNFVSVVGRESLFGDPSSGDEVDLMIHRANKFRAIFSQSSELDQRFPFAFEKSFSNGAPAENHWKLPDMATVHWLVGEAYDDGMHLHHQSIEVRQRMGGSPFRVSAVTLQLETDYALIREQLFKALSSALWANYAELVIASEISDEQLVEDIRKLADQFGVGVTSLGLSAETLDDLPESAQILNFQTREFEALQSLFNIRKISLPRDRGGLDWGLVNRYRQDSDEFTVFYDWLARCLMDETAYRYSDYLSLCSREESDKAEAPELHVVRS